MLQQIASVKKRIHIIGTQWVNKQSYDFAYDSQKLFKTQFYSQGSINMVEVLSLSFEQCFGPFTMSLVKGSSETGRFSHLFNDVFPSPEIKKYISYQGHPFV